MTRVPLLFKAGRVYQLHLCRVHGK